jgi:subtilisin family serine protease
MSRHLLRLCHLIAAVVLLVCLAGVVPARAESPAPYKPGEVIVGLNSTLSLLTFALAAGLDPHLGSLDQLGALPIYRLRIADGTSPLDKVAALLSNPLVVFAEPNYLIQTPESVQQSAWAKGGNDPGAYQGQWAPRAIRLPEAHAISRGAGVTVAVPDTGVDRSHPALQGHLMQGFDFVGLDADPSEEGAYGQDSAYGHGTHVIGLVALAAPDAKIMPLRILKPDGTGDSWLLAQAIRYAAERGAGVINMSYSVSHRSLLLDAVLSDVASIGSGTVVVAAAGNSASAAPEYPAAEDASRLLAVAASTRSDHLAQFSNYGDWVDLAAPGEQIVSTVPLASGVAYASWSGTSMAAPLTAGAAALVRSAFPRMRPSEVAQRIAAAATPIDGAVPRRLDAAAALEVP